MANNKLFYLANTAIDTYSYLRNIANINIYAGGTSSDFSTTPDAVLSIKNVPEFKIIEKHERYIEFGSCVTLSEIEYLGKNRLPLTIYDALLTIKNPFIKNLATIGGNICCKNIKNTLFASLLVLDARLEFHNSTDSMFIPMTKFKSVPEGYVLTKVRIPYGNWNKSFFCRVGSNEKIDNSSASFALLANIEKDILTNFSMAFAGSILINSKTLDNNLIGTRLPLTKKNIETMLETCGEYFDTIEKENDLNLNPILKNQYLNLLKYALKDLHN